MKVHIVCPNLDEDKILPRLARLLVAGTGWTLSDQPNGRADLNYWMVYIDYAQRHSDWSHTPRAAYFSHYEPDTPYKRKWWQDAAARVEIKTVTAPQYGEMLKGTVVPVTPPVDPEFTIQRRRRNQRPVVGVSGFVDPNSRRKGEALVQRLAADYTAADYVASGQGWPVRRVNDSLAGLPAFYNSLDVLLCTSAIEGIPMPPLEALACGVSVVIPAGVGMLDALPEMEGIYRYPAGDYGAMRAAVEKAVSGKPTRQKLRDAVSGYTPAAWVDSHVRGFKDALRQAAATVPAAPVSVAQPAATSVPRAPERAHHGNRGVYYVAFGEPARECALGAITSFKKHMPDVPVALVSSEVLGVEDIFIPCEDTDIGGRAAKVRINELAPRDWQYILYLDADTEIVADISFLYQLVEDGWDMTICRNPGRFHTAGNMVRPDNRDECEETFQIVGTSEVLQLNGGVFAFQRNARTAAFFAKWFEEWQRWGKRDQAALLRALWAQPLRLCVLGNEWNTITRYDAPETTAGILHYPMTARRWRGVVHHRSDSHEAWDAVRQFEREAAGK